MGKPKFKRGDKVWFLGREGRERRDQITGVLERYDGYYYELPYKSGDFIEESKLYTSAEELRQHMLEARLYHLENVLANRRGTLKYYQERAEQLVVEVQDLENQIKMLAPGKLPDPNAGTREE